MAFADIIQPSAMLGYNYAGVQSNGNTTLAFFDWDSARGLYKGAAALTENTDGTLTFWFYDQNFEDAATVYGEYFQFTWYSANGTSIDASAHGAQQALTVSTGPIPKGTSAYTVSYPFSYIQNFPNTTQIHPTFDAVAMPTPGGAQGVTDGAGTIYVFRARLHPTGPKGTLLTCANISHFENAHGYNHLFNDSTGPTSGGLTLTLQGPTPKPVLTAIAPAQGARGDEILLTGTGIVPGFYPYFGSATYDATVLELTGTSVRCIVPRGLPLGATTVYLSNGSYTTNALTFTVAANTLSSGYANELALTFPAPPPTVAPPPALVSVAILPGSLTITQGQSQQFRCLGAFADGTSAQLAANMSWATTNINGAGSIDPASGFFVAQTSGSNVLVTVNVPTGVLASVAGGAGIHAAVSGASVSASASVVIAAPAPVLPTLAFLTITPTDPELFTGSQLQLHAIGTNTAGSTIYPPVTWSIQNGLQRDPYADLSPADFLSGGTQGTSTNATPILLTGGVHLNTLNLVSGNALQSSTQSSYLSAGEFFWMEWQAQCTSASAASYGPAFGDGLGTFVLALYQGGAGTIELLSAAGSVSASATIPTNTANVNTQHAFLLGAQMIDHTHTRVVGYLDEKKIFDQTLAIGWLALAYPTFWSSDPANTFVRGMRTFFSNQATIDGTAAIDPYGLLTASQAGQITVFATAADGSGITASMDVTITDPVVVAPPAHLGTVSITPPSATCPAGTSLQFSATVLDQYGNPFPNVTLSWAVVNTAGAGTIDSQSGLFTGQIAGAQITVLCTAYSLDDTGTATIIGVDETYAHVSATAQVAVIPGQILRIAVTPATHILQIGQSQQYSAWGYDLYNNQLLLTSAQWTVVGGIGTISSSGLFTATSSGVGKIVATQKQLSGSASANVLAIVGGVVVSTTPQQPIARVHIRDVIAAPTIVDARVRGGGLRSPDVLDTSGDFWWDIARYDGKAFPMFGVYAVSILAPQLQGDSARTSIHEVLATSAVPHFLPVLVPGTPASPLFS